MASFDGRYMTSYSIAIVIFALSFTIYEIFANQIKCEKFDLDNESQAQAGEMREFALRLAVHFDDFFSRI